MIPSQTTCRIIKPTKYAKLSLSLRRRWCLNSVDDQLSKETQTANMEPVGVDHGFGETPISHLVLGRVVDVEAAAIEVMELSVRIAFF